MTYVLAVIVALFVVFLLAFISIKNPLYGKAMIMLSSFLIVLVSYLYYHKDQRLEKKKLLIPVAQIELTQLHYQLDYGNYYKLSANLSNHSPHYRLQSIALKISIRHCAKSSKAEADEDCQLLLEQQHDIRCRLPAQQSRLIESHFLVEDEATLAHLQQDPKDSIRWQFDLLYGLAR